MGTNYYRIPLIAEIAERKTKLIESIQSIDFANGLYIDKTIWNDFIKDTNVHLGKRSSGWQFNWDHNDWAYYKNPEEMLAFIRAGRVFDEYGTEIPVEEFIDMAKNWTGKTHQQYYEEQTAAGKHIYGKENYIDIVKDEFHYAPYTDFS